MNYNNIQCHFQCAFIVSRFFFSNLYRNNTVKKFSIFFFSTLFRYSYTILYSYSDLKYLSSTTHWSFGFISKSVYLNNIYSKFVQSFMIFFTFLFGYFSYCVENPTKNYANNPFAMFAYLFNIILQLKKSFIYLFWTMFCIFITNWKEYTKTLIVICVRILIRYILTF